MGYQDRDTLFVFLDESGNLDFSPSGTRYWSLTAFCTFHPSQGKEAFLDLLYSLADQNEGMEYFHATVDKQLVRDQVFSCINGLSDGHEIHCVIAEKRKAHPSLYWAQINRKGKPTRVKDESRFYRVVCKTLISYVFGCPRFQGAKKVVIVLSSLFNNPKHEAILKALRLELAARTKVPYHIYFHENKSDLNCQIADYCGWAIFRKWDTGDKRSYDLIRNKIKNEFDIFAVGNNYFY
jgi:hypothetical protein